MQIELQSWTPRVARDWDSFSAGFREANVFHTSAWVEFLRSVYRLSAYLLTVRRSGSICGAVPIMMFSSFMTGKRLVSLPFTDHCAALLEELEDVSAIVEKLIGFGLPFQLRDAYTSVDRAVSQEVGYSHQTSLKADPNEVFKTFKKTQVQQRIQRLERCEGLVAQQVEPELGLRVFYELHLRNRRRLRSLPQPWRHFRILGETVLTKGMGFVLIASYNNIPVASAVFLVGHRVLTYKYSASDPGYWQYHPNHALLWRAIQVGCQRGYKRLDWGRTGLHSEGLRSFKTGWGTREERLAYLSWRYPGPRRFRWALRLRNLVNISQPYLPLGFSRLAGEMLYQHFG